ncbi:MAG: DEAD/DEAH box helicase family protein [Deltaproteobacteria bacterium]|nr:DEAD/DEAH box helicase family protein [Deltaproteobacteria bacterium]
MKTVSYDAAAKLLDLSRRIGSPERGREQLEGAVALHNILCRQGVAYLADEVGMGKTYVALATVALFRHFTPSFRVLVIAPRENIQRKWVKELGNFVAHNVRFPDLRVKGLDGAPVRGAVICDGLAEFLREVTLDPDRDFFLRLTSFSIGLSIGDESSWRHWRKSVMQGLPWLPKQALDLRGAGDKQGFKENIARAINCAMPTFDLVVVDEGHNLKHGFARPVAARNRVLGLMLGHADDETDRRWFPEYGPRARRVLLLSATPIEDSYRHLYGQLDVVGKADRFRDLADPAAVPEARRETAGRFLVRRVTTIAAGGEKLSKNLYRREWRRGGVADHDVPIGFDADARQRLVVALVQKKVSELLGSEKFGAAFQIGMLASFESFLETAKVRSVDDEGNFDDAEQTDDEGEREGIDVGAVNGLAASYRRKFGAELPHPKMDALVCRLARAWNDGRKALVFVRRVASVVELKRKLDRAYDAWLRERLERELPAQVQGRLTRLWSDYHQAREARMQTTAQIRDATAAESISDTAGEEVKDAVRRGRRPADADHGGTDTFFAWFFRGEGPKGVLSGARLQQRFGEAHSALSTFFEDNHAAWLLGVRPGEVLAGLAGRMGCDQAEASRRLGERAVRYVSSAKPGRGDWFEAAQAGALELLRERDGEIGTRAAAVLLHRYPRAASAGRLGASFDAASWIETPTFFSELRRRESLRTALWPAPSDGRGTFDDQFREQELRARLVAGMSRLGHASIDLYICLIRGIGSLAAGAQAEQDESGLPQIEAWLDELERLQRTSVAQRGWRAFDELAEAARNFDLILDVNLPGARTVKLAEAARKIGTLLGKQQPIGPMVGGVNQTLVRQFRMPGYPLVLLTTDVLQEGEDLHTFCSDVYHYGIAWTPSSMEQRTGRIDRVRSQTDRRLAGLTGPVCGEDKLQVFYPHLQDTVEVLQVQKVLWRMNEFLRLMHRDLVIPAAEQRKLDVGREVVLGRGYPEPITTALETAFEVTEEMRAGDRGAAEVDGAAGYVARRRFEALRAPLPGLSIAWEEQGFDGYLVGTAAVGVRQQPFFLGLRSVGEHLVLRCVSPVGRIGWERALPPDSAAALAASESMGVRLGAVAHAQRRSHDLTVEDDVLLGAEEHDAARAAAIIARVVREADRLERALLPGKDQPLDDFRKDLVRETAGD